MLKEFRIAKSKLETITKITEDTQRELKDTKSKLESTTKTAKDSQSELKDTKLKLEATTKTAKETQTELQDTKLKLEATTKTAKETQSELKSTKRELDGLKKQMKQKEVPLLKAEVKVVDVVQLMGELVQLNPPRTTQRTYAQKLHRVFSEIDIGQLFHINENECFFKLRIQQNRQLFYFNHGDVTPHRNSRAEFENRVVALEDVSSSSPPYYVLVVEIEKYNANNCRSYVINVKKCGMNRLLEQYDNVDIRWKLYKNESKDVILYFNKN